MNLDIKKEFISGGNDPRFGVNCVDHKSCLILSVISDRIYCICSNKAGITTIKREKMYKFGFKPVQNNKRVKS